MSASLTGGCQCGAVRYQIGGRLPPVYAFHCRECQKQSASAFGLSMPVPKERLSLAGPIRSWRRATDSGSWTRCHFCGECGSRVYHAAEGGRDWVTVKGGSIDDPSALKPVAHIWVSRRQTWFDLPEGVPAYETQPETLEEWTRLFAPEEQYEQNHGRRLPVRPDPLQGDTAQ